MANEKMIQAPERTVERGRGCWNCTHFNNGDLARQHYRTQVGQEKLALRAQNLPEIHRLGDEDASVRDIARKTAELMRKGFAESEAQQIATADVQRQLGQIVAQAKQREARFEVFDRAMELGQIGICVAGHAPGDFVEHRYLCDKWDGMTGSSLATSGKPLDKLPDELVDIAESKATKA